MKTGKTSASDYLVEAARDRAGDILMVYEKFRENKPVMLLELPSQLVYAYPYLDFKNTLSERSQKMLEKDYEDAQRTRQIVIFVRDEAARKMISFSVDEGE